MNAEIVDGNYVANAIVERSAAGKTFALRGNLRNAHINAFVQLCVEGMVNLFKALDGSEIILDRLYLSN